MIYWLRMFIKQIRCEIRLRKNGVSYLCNECEFEEECAI